MKTFRDGVSIQHLPMMYSSSVRETYIACLNSSCD